MKKIESIKILAYWNDTPKPLPILNDMPDHLVEELELWLDQIEREENA